MESVLVKAGSDAECTDEDLVGEGEAVAELSKRFFFQRYDA